MLRKSVAVFSSAFIALRGQIGDNSLDKRVRQSTTFQHDNQSFSFIKWESTFAFLRREKFTIPRVPLCNYEQPKFIQTTHLSQSTTFYCDFLLQTLYPYSSSFKLFFSVRKLSGKFHKSCVCLCALRGDFSPFFCYGVVGALKEEKRRSRKRQIHWS